MELLTSAQVKQWDAYTCRQQRISSLELMERAAEACLQWLETQGYLSRSFVVFCGKGNNGGDGLALARMLSGKGCAVSVFVLDASEGSEDFRGNEARLNNTAVRPVYITSAGELLVINKSQLVIDALFGAGLNRALEGVAQQVVEHINASGTEVISLDIPSGMYADQSSVGNAVIKASHTLSFQQYKLAFLIPENEPNIGTLHILDIGLDLGFLETISSPLETIDSNIIKLVYKPRKPFSHKGTYGHALLIAGSYGKMGAAALSATSCLKSGVGLLTCHIPACGYTIMQTSIPEAMALTDENKTFITQIKTDLSKYNALGIGPGIGTEKATTAALLAVFSAYQHPVVLDADALNIIAGDANMLSILPAFSILTPHPKEFERLFGKAANDFDKIALATQKAKELQLVIVLKGHHTFIAMPGGKGYFNTTGNAGMATGGSGDVLTGLLTGLLAQQYTPAESALLGVYLHGLSGDLAAADLSQESLVASDIAAYLGKGFMKIQGY